MHFRIGVKVNTSMYNFSKLLKNRSQIRATLDRKLSLNRISHKNVDVIENSFDSINNMKNRLSSIMGVEAGYKPLPSDRSYLLKYLPKNPENLPPRSMQDSFVEAYIPLSKDLNLQDRYVTFLGHVRVGRLLEDMDIFAVVVAQKHILIPDHPDNVPSPYTLVTALVDKIDFSDYVPKPQADIKLSGHVSWVGRSSMEIVVWLEQKLHGTWNRITRALFLIAARDPSNTFSAAVNPIKPANERETRIYSGGQLRKKHRLVEASKHFSKVIPTEEEQRAVHSLYLRGTDKDNLRQRHLPPGAVWMENCTLSNVIFCQPEDRNLHNTIFGGFIMRQATELSWVAGFMYCKYRPKLKHISDINFSRPVAVGSLLSMHAYVVYSELNYFQIVVYAEIFDPTTGKTDTTNTFHFTYESPEVVPEVMPNTYHEAMLYIDGRRHFHDVMRPTSTPAADIAMLNQTNN